MRAGDDGCSRDAVTELIGTLTEMLLALSEPPLSHVRISLCSLTYDGGLGYSPT
jgi:hypothetical protein